MSVQPATAQPRSEGRTRIGVGMLGYSFMGRAHAHAYRTVGHMVEPEVVRPDLVTIAGRTEGALSRAADRFGFVDHTTDWRALVADSRVQLLDNSAPNHLHAEPTIAAASSAST